MQPPAKRLPILLYMALAVTGGPSAASAMETGESEQGRVIDGVGALLGPRERIVPENAMLEDRLEHLPPSLMAEAGLDMWLVIAREYAEDPVYFTLVPQPSHAARRTTMLVFHRLADGRVQRLSINRYPFGEPYESAWSGGDLGRRAARPSAPSIRTSSRWPGG